MSNWECSRKHIYKGSAFTAVFLSQGCRCPTADFIADTHDDTQTKAYQYVERLTNRGIPRNKELCQHLEDGIWELKPFPLRLLFFRIGDVLYFTHACEKKRQKLPKREIDRAHRIRGEFRNQRREETT